jgi:hypothetical protein
VSIIDIFTALGWPRRLRLPRGWQLWVLALPASVAIWSGWVALGEMCAFGLVHPLPGIADQVQLNTAITLPVGVEAYSAYALGTWLSARPMRAKARRFAKWSSMGGLGLGLVGQVIYHLLTIQGYAKAPVAVVVFVACLPVLVLGAGAALHHLLDEPAEQSSPAQSPTVEQPESSTVPAPDPASPAAPRAERPPRRKPKKAAPRRLLTDYLTEARTALTPEVDPTPAWCRQVTGCSAGTSVNLAKALRAERDQTGQVTDLPNTTARAEEEVAA